MKKLLLTLAFVGTAASAANVGGFSCPDCTFRCVDGMKGSSGQYGTWYKGGSDCEPKKDRLEAEMVKVCKNHGGVKESSLVCEKWYAANKSTIDALIKAAPKATGMSVEELVGLYETEPRSFWDLIRKKGQTSPVVELLDAMFVDDIDLNAVFGPPAQTVYDELLMDEEIPVWGLLDEALPDPQVVPVRGLLDEALPDPQVVPVKENNEFISLKDSLFPYITPEELLNIALEYPDNFYKLVTCLCYLFNF